MRIFKILTYRIFGARPVINSVDEGITYRYLSHSDSIDELTDLVNRSYSIYLEMGLGFMGASQDREKTLKRIRKAYCVVAEYEGRLVGTIAIKPSWKCKGSPWYNRKGVSKFNQLAVDPDIQNKGIGGKLLTIAENLAMLTGSSELALDTSEHAEKLIEFYKKRGYRFIEYADWKMTNYRSVILSKTLGGRAT